MAKAQTETLHDQVEAFAQKIIDIHMSDAGPDREKRVAAVYNWLGTFHEMENAYQNRVQEDS